MRIEKLADEIEKCIAEYTEEVETALESTKKDLARTGVASLKKTSPKRTGEYARGWTRKKAGRMIIIHNKRYQLTHLLEKGHARRNGGRVAAQVHIAPVEKMIQEGAESIFRRKLK